MKVPLWKIALWQMGHRLHNYLWLVVKTAWRHSLHTVHSIILVLIIVAGLATYVVPMIEVMVDLHGWQVATTVLVLVVTARLIAAPYWIWTADQKEIEDLNSTNPDARRLEIIFDESDLRCVRDEPDWYGGIRSRRWWVGIRNASLTRSIDEVSFIAQQNQFVDCTVRSAHFPRDRAMPRNLIIPEIRTLPPNAEKFVELFSLGGSDVYSEGDILAKKNRFRLAK